MSVAERRGGAENMLWLALRHHDPCAITPQVVFLEHGPFADEVAALGVRTRVFPAGRLRHVHRGLLVVARLARLITDDRPEVCLAWMGKTHLYSGVAALLTKSSTKAVWWLHDIPSGSWSEHAQQLVPAVAVGSSSARAARELAASRPKRQTFVVHPGVEAHRPLSVDDVRRRIRRELSIADETVLVGQIARFARQKGQHRVIEAVRITRDRGLDIEAVLVGGTAHGREPDYQRYVGDLIAKHGLESCIHRVGHQPDPQAYLHASDIVVNARQRENLSLGLLEAAAAERAVLAVADGGTPEIFDDRSAILIPEPSPSLIADGLERLASDKDLRVALGSAARRRFETEFTASVMARRLEKALTQIAAAP